MPMAILFIGFLAIVFLNELEVVLNKTGQLNWRRALNFEVAKKSTPTAIGLAVLAGLSFLEMKLFLNGRIYGEGISYSPIIRTALILLLCGLAVSYRAANLVEKQGLSEKTEVQSRKKKIIVVCAIVLAVFCALQFQILLGEIS